MLTPESFAVCFIAIVMLAFFMSENRHEEAMAKLQQEKSMNKMNFVILHQFETDNPVAILAESIVGFCEKDDTHACTVYFNNKEIVVRESFNFVSNMLKNLALTNLEWSESKPYSSFKS